MQLIINQTVLTQFVVHLYISPPIHPLNGDVEPGRHDVEQLLQSSDTKLVLKLTCLLPLQLVYQ